jgi:hypothetical protein
MEVFWPAEKMWFTGTVMAIDDDQCEIQNSKRRPCAASERRRACDRNGPVRTAARCGSAMQCVE